MSANLKETFYNVMLANYRNDSTIASLLYILSAIGLFYNKTHCVFVATSLEGLTL